MAATQTRSHWTRSYTAPSAYIPWGLSYLLWDEECLDTKSPRHIYHRRGKLNAGMTPWTDDWNCIEWNKELGHKRDWEHGDVDEFSLGEPIEELNYWEPEWEAQWETKVQNEHKTKKRKQLYGALTAPGRKRAYRKRTAAGRDENGRFVSFKPEGNTEDIGATKKDDDTTFSAREISTTSDSPIITESHLEKLQKLAEFYGYNPENKITTEPLETPPPKRPRLRLLFNNREKKAETIEQFGLIPPPSSIPE